MQRSTHLPELGRRQPGACPGERCGDPFAAFGQDEVGVELGVMVMVARAHPGGRALQSGQKPLGRPAGESAVLRQPGREGDLLCTAEEGRHGGVAGLAFGWVREDRGGGCPALLQKGAPPGGETRACRPGEERLALGRDAVEVEGCGQSGGGDVATGRSSRTWQFRDRR